MKTPTRFRPVYWAEDYGHARSFVLRNGRSRLGVQFRLHPKRGCRMHFMKMKIRAKKKLFAALGSPEMLKSRLKDRP